MTTSVDICNRALLKIGSQRIISSLSQDSVEAKACNTIYNNTRDDLLRMAPWSCAMKTLNLVYITSAPGTPENTSPATNLWQPGQPRPPWAYEYQYPVDCLRACWIIPASQTGFTGIPITTAVTGGAANTWLSGPIVFKVATDQFYPAVGFALVNGGTNYHTDEIITLSSGPDGQQPWGGPAQIKVLTVDGAGVILTAEIVNQVPDSPSPIGGSYFITDYTHTFTQASIQPSRVNPTAAAGATFQLSWGDSASQRVILTNQEFATLVYTQQVTDPNVFDSLFSSALQDLLAAQLTIVLKDDKQLTSKANQFITKANASIAQARAVDGNEGLTINDVTPDWIRVRGYGWDIENLTGPYSSFDWGAFLPSYG